MGEEVEVWVDSLGIEVGLAGIVGDLAGIVEVLGEELDQEVLEGEGLGEGLGIAVLLGVEGCSEDLGGEVDKGGGRGRE